MVWVYVYMGVCVYMCVSERLCAQRGERCELYGDRAAWHESLVARFENSLHELRKKGDLAKLRGTPSANQ